VNTEITDNVKLNGWVCYDADCGICTRLAERFRALLAGHRFELVPLQSPWVRERLGLAEAELLEEMRLLKSDGRVIGGADALLEIARDFWWTWPLRLLGRIPVVREWLRAGYRWVARRRSCASGVCEVQAELPDNRASVLECASTPHVVPYKATLPAAKGLFGRAMDILPLFVLPVSALLCRPFLPPWIFMWAIAFALYAGCKWLTYRLAIRNHPVPAWPLRIGYLLAWPGMGATKFVNRTASPARPRGIEWIFAMGKMIFGIEVLWMVARTALPDHPLLAGWVGMIGVVFMLHFGLFHLLSLAWRGFGVDAMPVMQNPLLAKSLADFWGGRWNTAFNELAFRFTFRPLRRLTTPAVATLAVFGLSGLIHELVISLPADGGYGLPTLYFLAQGAGVIAERSRWGRKIGLGHGLRGWLFTVFVTAGPAFWLFHPPFIHHVILPMLTAIGAT
jgi:predicted DCC family thiol-disulfide oxidoreductase YuxK